MQKIRQIKKEKGYIKNAGALLLIWTIFSCALAVYILVKLGRGQGDSSDGILLGFIGALIFLPGFMILKSSLKKEHRRILERKIEKLIKKGKYDKALKVLESHEFKIYSPEILSEIKKKFFNEKGTMKI